MWPLVGSSSSLVFGILVTPQCFVTILFVVSFLRLCACFYATALHSPLALGGLGPEPDAGLLLALAAAARSSVFVFVVFVVAAVVVSCILLLLLSLPLCECELGAPPSGGSDF